MRRVWLFLIIILLIIPSLSSCYNVSMPENNGLPKTIQYRNTIQRRIPIVPPAQPLTPSNNTSKRNSIRIDDITLSFSSFSGKK